MENNNYIAHWGIKGMKWGIRKEEAVTSKERINQYDNDTKLALVKEKNRQQKELFRQQRLERRDTLKAQKIIEKSREKKLKQAGVAIAGASAAILIVVGKYMAKRKAATTGTAVSFAHSGIKGMKWGVRRYQNEDGTLTEGGKARYRKTSDGKYEKLDARTMTNQELDASNMRFAKEAQYNNATGNEHRNPGYKKNLAEKTIISGLGAFALSSAASFVANKFGRDKPLAGKDLAKRVLANGLLGAGIASITAFATATGKAQNLNPNTTFDTYVNKAEAAKKKP